MTDNITLPRAVVEQVREALLSFDNWWDDEADTALAALDAALAEPEPEPVAWMYVNLEGECEQIEYGTPSIDDDSITLLYTAPPKPDAKPEPVAHVENGVLVRSALTGPFYAALAEQKPEPATRWQIAEAYIKPDIDGRWRDFELGFRAAERFHGIGGSKT
jgi:hypothetical protein